MQCAVLYCTARQQIVCTNHRELGRPRLVAQPLTRLSCHGHHNIFKPATVLYKHVTAFFHVSIAATAARDSS